MAALLRATEDAGFEVFVTVDKKLSYQQNLGGRALAVVVLSTLDWEIMKPYLSRIVAAVDAGLASVSGVREVSEIGSLGSTAGSFTLRQFRLGKESAGGVFRGNRWPGPT